MSTKKITNPLLQAWNNYLDDVYPDMELDKRQHDECQQAFHAGYVESIAHMIDLLDYPQDVAKDVLNDRLRLLRAILGRRMEQLELLKKDF